MNSKVIIPILIYILFIIIAITFVIGIFYFNWFSNGKNTNTYNKITENIETYKDKTDDGNNTENVEGTELDKKAVKNAKEKKIEINSENLTQINLKKNDADNKQNDKIISYINNDIQNKVYGKGSSLPDVSFDAQGEYVSDEEYQYRLSLIQNLTVKSVVVDKLTKGNGVSQEFFKVVYKEKMIPARILEAIVESKEFRELIPVKYRSYENKIVDLKKGEKVVFNNKSIRELLILWSLGRLTPVQKAWKVKAEK